ncbi:hypothetical protein GCM10009743_25200 [Kribbella swartbergensis]
MRAPHIGMPRWTRHAGTSFIGNAAANAASDLGASSMCQVTISGAGPSPAGGRAVNGTPAAVPATGEGMPQRYFHERGPEGGYATGRTRIPNAIPVVADLAGTCALGGIDDLSA